MDHDLHEFMRRIQAELQADYERLHKKAGQDPGTAGDQGENNWERILGEWLPPYFHVRTKGKIQTESGYQSPQVDVVVLSPSYPGYLLERKDLYYLAAGVVAAFECKTTLTRSGVKRAVKAAAELKRATPRRPGTPFRELHSNIVYGLLAHSHEWKQPTEGVSKALWAADHEFVRHPRECIDFIALADTAAWCVTKESYVAPLVPTDDRFRRTLEDKGLAYLLDEAGHAASGYICYAIGAFSQSDPFSPIGSFLYALYSRLAWDYPDMRRLKEYLQNVNLHGSGHGELRPWTTEIYTDPVRERMRQDRTLGLEPFDEWAFMFGPL